MIAGDGGRIEAKRDRRGHDHEQEPVPQDVDREECRDRPVVAAPEPFEERLQAGERH